MKGFGRDKTIPVGQLYHSQTVSVLNMGRLVSVEEVEEMLK